MPASVVGGPVRGASTGPLNDGADGLPVLSVNAANDIAEFLASRRARITPEQAGLPSYGKRRVPGPASRGGRVAGRRERGLLPAPGARPGQRRLRARARSAGAGAPARRGRARAPVRPRPRRQPGRAASARGRPRSAPPGRAAAARPDRGAGDRQHRLRRLPGRQRAGPRAVRAGVRESASSPPTAGGSPSWTRRPSTSTPIGSGWPPSSSRPCARRPGATPTTATSRT